MLRRKDVFSHDIQRVLSTRQHTVTSITNTAGDITFGAPREKPTLKEVELVWNGRKWVCCICGELHRNACILQTTVEEGCVAVTAESIKFFNERLTATGTQQ